MRERVTDRNVAILNCYRTLSICRRVLKSHYSFDFLPENLPDKVEIFYFIDIITSALRRDRVLSELNVGHTDKDMHTDIHTHIQTGGQNNLTMISLRLKRYYQIWDIYYKNDKNHSRS